MTLAQEAQRYLAVVEFFRAQGCEPHWQPEAPPALGPTGKPNANASHAKQTGA